MSSPAPQAQKRPASVMSMTISVEARKATSPPSRPKPRVDVAGEDVEEAVDDAIVHVRRPRPVGWPKEWALLRFASGRLLALVGSSAACTREVVALAVSAQAWQARRPLVAEVRQRFSSAERIGCVGNMRPRWPGLPALNVTAATRRSPARGPRSLKAKRWRLFLSETLTDWGW